MAGGHHRGNSDPMAIIGDSQPFAELGSQELMRCYELYGNEIDMLWKMTDSFDPDGPESVTSFSNNLQANDDSLPDLMNEVIQILSANGAFFDDDDGMEDLIARDPLIISLSEVKGNESNMKTLRLKRSLVAIYYFREMAGCSGN